MAFENVTGGLSFKVLPDEMRKRLNGSMSYIAVDANDKWVYAKKQITHTSGNILTTDDDYLMAPATAVAAGDKYKFLLIRHTGFTDSNENVSSPYGVMFAIDAGTPAYNDANLIFLAPGDMMVLKPVSYTHLTLPTKA